MSSAAKVAAAIPHAKHSELVQAFINKDDATMQALGVETGGETMQEIVEALVGESGLPTPTVLNNAVESILVRLGLKGANAAIMTEVANAVMNMFPGMNVAKKATLQNYLANLLQGLGSGYIDLARWRGRHTEAEQITNTEEKLGIKLKGEDLVILLPLAAGVSSREYHLPKMDADGKVVVIDGRLQTKCHCGTTGFAMHTALYPATVTTQRQGKNSNNQGNQTKKETKVPPYLVEDDKLANVRFQPGYSPCELCFPKGHETIAVAKDKTWLDKVGKTDDERGNAMRLRLAFIRTAKAVDGHIEKAKAEDYGNEIEKIPADQFKALVKAITVKLDGTIEHDDLETIVGLIRQHGGNLELHNKALAGVESAKHAIDAAMEAVPGVVSKVGYGYIAVIVAMLIGWVAMIGIGWAIPMTIFGLIAMVMLVAAVKPLQAATTPIAKGLGGGAFDWLYSWVRSVWWYIGVTTLIEATLIQWEAPSELRWIIPGLFGLVGGAAKAVLGGTFEGRQIIEKADRNQAVLVLLGIGLFVVSSLLRFGLVGDEFIVKYEEREIKAAYGPLTASEAAKASAFKSTKIGFVRTPNGVFFAEDVVWDGEAEKDKSGRLVLEKDESLRMPHYKVKCGEGEKRTCIAHKEAWIATPLDGIRGDAKLHDSPEDAIASEEFKAWLKAKSMVIWESSMDNVDGTLDNYVDLQVLERRLIDAKTEAEKKEVQAEIDALLADKPAAKPSTTLVDADRSAPTMSGGGSSKPDKKARFCAGGADDNFKAKMKCPGYTNP